MVCSCITDKKKDGYGCRMASYRPKVVEGYSYSVQLECTQHVSISSKNMKREHVFNGGSIGLNGDRVVVEVVVKWSDRGRGDICEGIVVVVVDSSFLEVNLPWISNRNEARWVNLVELRTQEMSITLFLAIFLGGFLVDDEALVAIFEEIKEDFERERAAAVKKVTKEFEHPFGLLEFWRFSSGNKWKLVHVDNQNQGCNCPLDDHFLFGFEWERVTRMIPKEFKGIENNVFALDFTGFSGWSFIENSITHHFGIFNGRQVVWIRIGAITKRCNRPFGHEHAYTLTRNTKNSSKFLESETNLNIVDNKGNGNSFVQVSNESNASIELKDKHEANLFIDI
ncbi:hypothetical protein Tco_0417743 [Tanacetum coccineum]